MSDTVLIVLIVGVGIVAVVFVLRDRITEMTTGFSRKKGEGSLKFKAAPPVPSQPSSVNDAGASDNTMIGSNEIGLTGPGARSLRNRLFGKNKITVSTEEKK